LILAVAPEDDNDDLGEAEEGEEETELFLEDVVVATPTDDLEARTLAIESGEADAFEGDSDFDEESVLGVTGVDLALVVVEEEERGDLGEPRGEEEEDALTFLTLGESVGVAAASPEGDFLGDGDDEDLVDPDGESL
jgi:hypothetical protein